MSHKQAHRWAPLKFLLLAFALTVPFRLVGRASGIEILLDLHNESTWRLLPTDGDFHVETMGRDCGCLALMTGIAGGAEAVVIPEVETDSEFIAAELRSAYGRGKARAIVVVFGIELYAHH